MGVTIHTNDVRLIWTAPVSIEGRNDCALKRRYEMRDIFNIASLARLSKAELIALLANYQAKLANSQTESEKANIQSKIHMIKLALNLK